MNTPTLLQGMVLGLGLAASASAQIVINSNITTSQTWFASNVYQLDGEIYVLPGATLTIQPGTQIRSANTSTASALTISRGAQIIANGTRTQPIVWTSTLDNGTFRVACNEWGNLNIHGTGYISENQIATNTPAPNASNYANMEGLTNATLNRYGGGNDNDDSGSLSFNSFRYGGFTLAPGVELNGLSLGGVGRNTECNYIEIFNNLDDGIEVWGGTVNFKYVSIWNVGDDSFDLDQGWRGQAQFGLIVQGFCGNGIQGGGFGDNALEIDGAELCNYQPVTTCALYNFTVIGMRPEFPGESNAGDHLVAFRDNANVQFHNSIFMNAGDNVIQNENSDGENGNTGYGCPQGTPPVPTTLNWAQRWTTSATYTDPLNAFAPPEITPAQAYTAQLTSGNNKLIQFRDNVFFNNIRPNTYNEANARSVFTAEGGGTNNNHNSIVALSPITSLTLGAFQIPNGINKGALVTFVDPTPANSALSSVEFAPNNGFYDSARYRGAFERGNNWLIGWSAASIYGLTSNSPANVPITGYNRSGANGVPVHHTIGTWAASTPVTLSCDNVGDLGGGLRIGILVFGAGVFPQFLNPVLGINLYPTPDVLTVVTAVNATGEIALPPFLVPTGLSGQTYHTQYVTFDLGVPPGEFAASNGQRHTLP